MITSFKATGLEANISFDITLQPDSQVYCFIGKNGIGKTQLLENMAKALIFSHSIFHAPDERYHYANLFMQNTIHQSLKNQQIRLPSSMTVNDVAVKDVERHKWGFASFEHIQGNQTEAFICDKPVVYIGAKNRGFTKNLDTNNIKILADGQHRFVESLNRTLRYINSEGLDHQEIADWFTSRLIINPNFVNKGQNKVHEAVTVLKLIDRLEPSLNLVTTNDRGNVGLKLIFSEGQLLVNGTPLDKLSTGYVSIIKIFQEIVAGYGGWSNSDNLNEVDGIVFIDEIEPHLHIGWQTKIIRVLREAFPKTTFFISTHSPLVLSGLKTGEGYELVSTENTVSVNPIEHIENYFLNDIVNEFFGVDLTQERLNHVDKTRQQKTKSMLLQLAKTLQEEGDA
jgi:hypothetical protein